MENQIKIPRSFGNPTHCHRQCTVGKNRDVSSSESVNIVGRAHFQQTINITRLYGILHSNEDSLSPLHTLHTVFLFQGLLEGQSSLSMTDTTDDIAEEISFQSFEDDCKLLGSLFNDVLQREVGSDFMEKIERTRVLAQVFASLSLCSQSSSVIFRVFCSRSVNVLLRSFRKTISIDCDRFVLRGNGNVGGR